jgi:hypothetical protein
LTWLIGCDQHQENHSLQKTDKGKYAYQYPGRNTGGLIGFEQPSKKDCDDDENERGYSSHLASLNSRPENIVVEAIIVPELELRNVKMQVLLAHVVESADDPALEYPPEAFNRVGVHSADNVLALGMVNGDVQQEARLLSMQNGQNRGLSKKLTCPTGKSARRSRFP